MAIATDDILTKGKGPSPAKVSNIPPVDNTLSGAPATVQGSGDGGGTSTIMKGVTPANTATVAPPVSPDIAGAPNAGQAVTPPGSAVSYIDKVQQAEPKKLSYVELYQQMSPYRPPTDEELEKERKKQKRNAIFAAIGDGISALSNLYFTTQYAPNAYDPSKGMSAATKTRFDKLKKEREDNQREYMNGFLRAMQMDDNANYKDLLAQIKEKEQKRKDSETAITIALKQAELDLKNAKTDGQEYINELYKLKGKAIEAGIAPTVALIEEKINTERSRQYKNYHSGSGSGGSGGTSKQYPAYNPSTGETIYITAKDSKHAWSQCPQGFTIRQEPSTSVGSSVTDSEFGGKKTTVVTTKKNSNDNLDGPRGNGKKGTPSYTNTKNLGL